MPKFVLPKKTEGVTIIADRYKFVDGEMPVSETEAMKLDRILGRFYGCKLVLDTASAETNAKKTAEGSLKAESTKPGQKPLE